MFALSAQSFAVSARYVGIVSHPIARRRDTIFLFSSRFFFFVFCVRENRIGENRGGRNHLRFTRRKMRSLSNRTETNFPTAQSVYIKVSKNSPSRLFRSRNAVVHRKQTSKRASFKVRAEVRDVVSFALAPTTTPRDSFFFNLFLLFFRLLFFRVVSSFVSGRPGPLKYRKKIKKTRGGLSFAQSFEGDFLVQNRKIRISSSRDQIEKDKIFSFF